MFYVVNLFFSTQQENTCVHSVNIVWSEFYAEIKKNNNK